VIRSDGAQPVRLPAASTADGPHGRRGGRGGAGAGQDNAGLLFVAEMYGVQADQLAAVLRVSERRANGIIAGWLDRGLAEAGRLGPGPRWVWLTRAGLTACGVPYAASPPALSRLAHLRAVTAVRLALEAVPGYAAAGAHWRSERRLRARLGGRLGLRDHLPDAEVHWPDGDAAPATGPAGILPASSEPASSEPASSEPASSEPASSEPASAEPPSSEPASAEPASTEPASAEPTSSEPASTEPASSEPARVAPAWAGECWAIEVELTPKTVTRTTAIMRELLGRTGDYGCPAAEVRAPGRPPRHARAVYLCSAAAAGTVRRSRDALGGDAARVEIRSLPPGSELADSAPRHPATVTGRRTPEPAGPGATA
jgi:hypothetical protein